MPPAHRSFADTSGNILRSTGATICPKFFCFFLFLYSFLIFSFCYSLLIFLSFLFLFIHIFLSFSSYSSYSSRTILRLLILLFLYLNLFFVLQTCRGQSLFWFIWGQSIYLCDHLILLFISLLILIFFTHLAKLHTWTAKLIIYRENPAKIPVWQKIRQSIPLLI